MSKDIEEIARLRCALSLTHERLSIAQEPRRTEGERTVCINRALDLIEAALNNESKPVERNISHDL